MKVTSTRVNLIVKVFWSERISQSIKVCTLWIRKENGTSEKVETATKENASMVDLMEKDGSSSLTNHHERCSTSMEGKSMVSIFDECKVDAKMVSVIHNFKK